ncbi:MAG: M48 family metallopeptidase [Gammaproteobacteria bacterium]|nr:M48 family metallopeptidase [Gammaproteobacteria bacterium]
MTQALTSVPNDIDFTIKRSRRKTVAIHVHINAVEVRAPYGTPQSFIDEFVAEKRQWIINKLLEQEQKQSEVLLIVEGATIPFMGYEINLSFEQAKRNSAKLYGDNLVLKISDYLQESKVKLMDRWLLQQAKQEIPELVEIFAKEMNLWQKISQIKFRKTKSKWGHCTAKGVLQFNPLILLAPEYVMNYLIVHELCHLVHHNHSKAYWQLVAQYDSNYQAAEGWLKNQGHRLWYR